MNSETLRNRLCECCEMVDIFKGVIHEQHEEIEAKREIIEKGRETIDDLNQVIEVLEYDLGICKGSGTANDLYIAGLKSNNEAHGFVIDELKRSVSDFRDITAYLKNINKQHEKVVSDLMNTNVGLESELSARKKDSVMLMQVVEALCDWNSDPINPRRTIKRIRAITEDYVNPPEPPTDEEHHVVVKMAFLELP